MIASVVIDERLGYWARQVRGRLAAHSGAVCVRECRSRADLLEAIEPAASPIVLVQLDDSPLSKLADIVDLLERRPAARVLVLDPNGWPESAVLLREAGVTELIHGYAAPPRVVALIERWLPMALASEAAQPHTRGNRASDQWTSGPLARDPELARLIAEPLESLT